MLKIRRSRNRLIFNMGISIPGKDSLYIEMVPWTPVLNWFDTDETLMIYIKICKNDVSKSVFGGVAVPIGVCLLSQFPLFCYLTCLSELSSIAYILNIIFIFDRCLHSSAAVTPVKHECDLWNAIVTYVRLLEMSVALTNQALVSPTEGHPWDYSMKPI